MPKPKKIKWSPEVIAAAKHAAVALAEFWDAMLAVEGETGISFDGTIEAISALAGDCNVPPAPGDLDTNMVKFHLDNLRRE